MAKMRNLCLRLITDVAVMFKIGPATVSEKYAQFPLKL